MRTLIRNSLFLNLALIAQIAVADVGISPFKSWNTCPKTQADFAVELKKLVNRADEFGSQSGAELWKIIAVNDWRGVYLEHLAPYLLPTSMKTEAAKTCWVLFQEMSNSVEAGEWKEAKTAGSSWTSCLSARYAPVPKELIQIATCLNQVVP